MSLNSHNSYYGRMQGSIHRRSLTDDLLVEHEGRMLHELKEMEDRLKRHITECKREVIKEIENIFSDPKPTYSKESKYVGKNRINKNDGRHGSTSRICTEDD